MRVFTEQHIDALLYDDEFFTNFNLVLPTQVSGPKNKFNGLNYATLGDYQGTLDTRPIRCFIVKQTSPADDDSAVYEIFNRLNSGGVNLKPQEIRMSLYHSHFYDMLLSVNLLQDWRRFIKSESPDLNMKDIEFILRGFAMFVDGNRYNSSMVKFLNDFSRHAKLFSDDDIDQYNAIFQEFLWACSTLNDDAFWGTTRRFSITIFESVFVAVCTKIVSGEIRTHPKIVLISVDELKTDPIFLEASQISTASKNNVSRRLERAKKIIKFQ